MHSVAALYLFFAVYGVAFALCGLVPGITLITRWFQLRRSIAISITSTGLSLGGIALTPVAKSLIKTHQLGGAGPIMAAIWVVGVIPLAMLFIRSRPADKGLAADGIPLEAVPAGQTAAPVNIVGATFDQARRTRFFVMLCVAYALIFFSQVGGLAHLFKLATDRVDDGTGSLALALLAATSVAGRLMGGLVVLRVPTKVFSMILVALQAMALFAVAMAESRWSVLASAVFLGVSVGNLLMLQPLLLAEAFGVKEYSRIYGLNQLVSTIGVAGGPLVLGFVHDATSYTTAFVVAAIGSVLGFLAFLAAGPITGPLRLWTDTPAPVPAAVPAVVPAVAAPAPGAVLPVSPLVATAD